MPLGSMGRHFVKRLTEELNGVPYRYWNYGPPLVFVTTITPTTENARSSKDIISHIDRWMEIWDKD